MPTAFMRSPADSLAGVTAKDKLRRRRRGLLLQEDKDQDQGYAEGRTGPQRTGPNMRQNRDITMGSGNVRPKYTKTGVVGQEPSARDTVGGRAVGRHGQANSVHPGARDDGQRDDAGSMLPQGDAEREPM